MKEERSLPSGVVSVWRAHGEEAPGGVQSQCWRVGLNLAWESKKKRRSKMRLRREHNRRKSRSARSQHGVETLSLRHLPEWRQFEFHVSNKFSHVLQQKQAGVRGSSERKIPPARSLSLQLLALTYERLGSCRKQNYGPLKALQ